MGMGLFDIHGAAEKGRPPVWESKAERQALAACHLFYVSQTTITTRTPVFVWSLLSGNTNQLKFLKSTNMHVS